MRTFNVFDGATEEAGAEHPDGYRARRARFGPALGAAMIGVTVYDLPPGQSNAPYHSELGDEEWVVVLQGEPTLRAPDGEHRLRPGDAVCFPPGREGAHKVTNETDGTVRTLMFSTRRTPSVAIFPDSDKVSLIAADEGDNIDVPRAAAVGYWHGE
jgi:uncharacterized cupin superfamily protein